MKKKTLFATLIILLTIFSFYFVSNKKSSSRPDLIVTIAPYKYFVERLTDHSLEVKNLIPEIADPHGFSPPAKELIDMFSAKAWFLVGEPFEKQLMPILKKNNPQIQGVPLNEDLETLDAGCCAHHKEEDLHFWMSPRIARIQVKKIAHTLKEIYPEKAPLIDEQLALIEQDFDQLNQNFLAKLENLQNKHLLVSHPAFGYFCKDYHLHQISLEDESLDISPRELTLLYDHIAEHQIKTLYVQKQHSYKMAQLTAKALDLKMVDFNPYTENYFENMHHFADLLGE